MGEAFMWGVISAAALLVGALVAFRLRPGRRVIATVMALGAGLLLGSVSFELIDEALKTRSVGGVALFVLIGAGTFTLGDWLLSRRGGGERKDAEGAQASGSPFAIVLGSVLDGIPSRFYRFFRGGRARGLAGAVRDLRRPDGGAGFDPNGAV